DQLEVSIGASFRRRVGTLEDLASLYQAVGELKLAYNTLKKLGKLYDQLADHRDADWTALQVVFVGHKLGLDAQTEEFLKKERDLLITSEGENSDGSTVYMMALAELRLIQRQYAEAEHIARQVLAIRHLTQMPSRHMRMAMETLFRSLIAQHKY